MSELTIFAPGGRQLYANVSSSEDRHRFWLYATLGAKVKTKLVQKPLSFLPGETWWAVAAGNLDKLITQGLKDFARVTVTRRIYEDTRCDVRCVAAKLNVCVCACGGENHRGTTEGYKLVGATTLVSEDFALKSVTYEGSPAVVPAAA